MKKYTVSQRDELTEKMHSEFAISNERELALKVLLAKQAMKEFNYTIAQVFELYGLSEEELGVVENN